HRNRGDERKNDNHADDSHEGSSCVCMMRSSNNSEGNDMPLVSNLSRQLGRMPVAWK
ncbi:unnamed protein product, partial [marine sediment metagenome]